MLAWAEARYDEKDIATRPLGIEVMDGNAPQAGLLTSRRYGKQAGHYIHRHKPLSGPHEPVPLPEGHAVKAIETQAEMEAFHRAVKAVFGFEDSIDVYKIVQRAPSYVPELDLIVIPAGGEVAAFCTAWLDGASGVAELEPVGTAPHHRQRGLAAALLAEASNRLRALDCQAATVNAWSESTAANSLYQAAGFHAQATIDTYHRNP
jgi:ribosomal protein S18 acetylase RimI-like enzyme